MLVVKKPGVWFSVVLVGAGAMVVACKTPERGDEPKEESFELAAQNNDPLAEAPGEGDDAPSEVTPEDFRAAFPCFRAALPAMGLAEVVQGANGKELGLVSESDPLDRQSRTLVLADGFYEVREADLGPVSSARRVTVKFGAASAESKAEFVWEKSGERGLLRPLQSLAEADRAKVAPEPANAAAVVASRHLDARVFYGLSGAIEDFFEPYTFLGTARDWYAEEGADDTTDYASYHAKIKPLFPVIEKCKSVLSEETYADLKKAWLVVKEEFNRRPRRAEAEQP